MALIHTFDNVYRDDIRQRSQCYKWFSVTILYYVCDRAAMYMNHRYQVVLKSFSAISGSDGTKMVIIRLRRPTLFSFKPGQYAFVRLAQIDGVHFHPFSIASSPDSPLLEFYIEVFEEGSWTDKLWAFLENQESSGGQSVPKIVFEVMGPYGTSLGKASDYSHALVIGAGTGVVPVLSLFQQHVHRLLELDPEHHLWDMQLRQQKTLKILKAQRPLEGPFVKKVLSACRGQKRIKTKKLPRDRVASIQGHVNVLDEAMESQGRDLCKQESRRYRQRMQHASFKATKSIYGFVALGALPVLGVALIGFTLSWNTITNPYNRSPDLDVDVAHVAYQLLMAFTVIFQFVFAFVCLFIWNAKSFFFYIDAMTIVAAPFLDIAWFHRYVEEKRLTTGQIALYCFIMGYMTARLWSRSVERPNNGTGALLPNRIVLDNLKLVWSTRSAHLVSKLLPDLKATWNLLVENWGEENAKEVCSVTIYVTDKNHQSNEFLLQELEDTCFEFHFERPNFELILQEHSLDLFSTHEMSHSMLGFCGSPKVASMLEDIKIKHDALLCITGHTNHRLDFVAENYGGVKTAAKQKPTPSPEQQKQEPQKLRVSDASSLATRRNTTLDGLDVPILSASIFKSGANMNVDAAFPHASYASSFTRSLASGGGSMGIPAIDSSLTRRQNHLSVETVASTPVNRRNGSPAEEKGLAQILEETEVSV